MQVHLPGHSGGHLGNFLSGPKIRQTARVVETTGTSLPGVIRQTKRIVHQRLQVLIRVTSMGLATHAHSFRVSITTTVGADLRAQSQIVRMTMLTRELVIPRTKEMPVQSKEMPLLCNQKGGAKLVPLAAASSDENNLIQMMRSWCATFSPQARRSNTRWMRPATYWGSSKISSARIVHRYLQGMMMQNMRPDTTCGGFGTSHAFFERCTWLASSKVCPCSWRAYSRLTSCGDGGILTYETHGTCVEGASSRCGRPISAWLR